VLLAASTAVGVACAFWGLSILRAPDPIKDRLSEFAPTRPRSLEDIELSVGAKERIWTPIFRRIALYVVRRTPQASYQQIKRNLLIAGNPHNLDATDFLGIKGCMALFLTFMGVVLFAKGGSLIAVVAIPGALGAMGYILPSVWLGGKMRA